MMRRARYNPSTLSIALPPIPRPRGDAPRLLDDERYWMTDKTLHELAWWYVSRHGHKYAIDRDEQVSILFLKMCAMVANGSYDYERAAFSTLCCGTAFPRTLYREAVMRGRVSRPERLGDDLEDRRPDHASVEAIEAAGLIDRLPEPQRGIVRMAFGIDYPEITTREIAILLRKTPAWVRKRIDEGLNLLRAAYGSASDEGPHDERRSRKGYPKAGDGLPLARGSGADPREQRRVRRRAQGQEAIHPGELGTGVQ